MIELVLLVGMGFFTGVIEIVVYVANLVRFLRYTYDLQLKLVIANIKMFEFYIINTGIFIILENNK